MKVRKQHLNIALFVLAAAVLWTVWGIMKPAARQTSLRVEPLLQSSEQVVSPVAVFDPATIPAPAEIDTVREPSWARDPFLFGNESRTEKVGTTAQVVLSNPVVRSILVSSTRRVALVENRMVSVGESVGSFKVAEINSGSVVFVTASGERRQVPLQRPLPAGIKR